MKDEAVMTDVVEKNDSSEIKKDWYSLRVISGKERVVEESITYEAKMNDIADTIGEVFVPFEKIVEIKNNKKVLKEKVFFPGYILINMNMNSLTKHVIENIQYVIRFVGPKGKDPIPLRDSEIKRIFGEVERKEGREMLVSPFSKGNHVKIIAGPFIDFVGVVEEANDDKQKVKITISIFGRPTPVELDYYQVQLEK
tara:strand:+ start:1565 stop:2155 length:591 start_codon:yes stop_codon:yes gene_type:complete